MARLPQVATGRRALEPAPSARRNAVDAVAVGQAMRRLALLAAAALSGCVATPRLAVPAVAPAPTPRFDALTFFAGRLQGEGRLRKMGGRTEPVSVESRGRLDDGVLHLEQVVREGAKPPRSRAWAIREVAPGRYRGTLSDAAGPVTGEAVGNRLHLAFRLKGGLAADQWLTLAPDGRSAANVLKVRKLGITVAVLAETIRKLD